MIYITNTDNDLKNMPACVPKYDYVINCLHEVLNYYLVYTRFLHSKVKIWADKVSTMVLNTRIKLQSSGKLTTEIIFMYNKSNRNSVDNIKHTAIKLQD